MRTNLAALSLAPLLLGLTSPSSSLPAQAGVFDARALPSDTQWVAHLDFDALRASDLGRGLLDAIRGLSQANAEEEDSLGFLGEIEQELGIDPLVDIRGITLHGRGADDDGLLQVTTTARGGSILQRMRQEDSYGIQTFGEHEMHSIGDDGDRAFIVLEPTGENEMRFVVAGEPDSVVDQIRLLHREKPSLADSQTSSLTARPSSSSFLFIAGSLPKQDWAQVDELSEMSKLVRGGVLEFGQNGGNLALNLAVNTASTQDARRLTALVQTGLALLELVVDDESRANAITQLLSGMSFTQSQSEVRLTIECPGQDLERLLHEVAQD